MTGNNQKCYIAVYLYFISSIFYLRNITVVKPIQLTYLKHYGKKKIHKKRISRGHYFFCRAKIIAHGIL